MGVVGAAGAAIGVAGGVAIGVAGGAAVGVGAVAKGRVEAVSIARWGIDVISICILDGVIAVAIGWGISAIGGQGTVGVGVCILSGVVAIAIGWADSGPIAKPLKVWFSLSLAVLE